MHPFHTYPSFYLATILWGCIGFAIQPHFVNFILFFTVLPIILLLILWLAHWEGRKEFTKS